MKAVSNLFFKDRLETTYQEACSRVSFQLPGYSA